MAFTIAHFAAALPFYKRYRWLNFDAILMGTIMPDLPYYVPHILAGGRHFAYQSHQWLGILSYCLPVGLILFTVWYWLVKPALHALVLPWGDVKFLSAYSSSCNHKVSNRLHWPASQFRSILRFWLVVAVSLIIGASTHLIWDGITHPDGFIAEQVRVLQYSISVPYLGDMVIARVLQYCTSIVGLGLLLRFVWPSIPIQVKDSEGKYLESKHSANKGSRNRGQSDINTGIDHQLPYDYLNSSFAYLRRYQPISLRKHQSIWLLSIIWLIPLAWGVFAVFKWADLFIVDNYDFFVYFFLGFIRRLGLTLLLYVVGYHFVNLLRLSYFSTHKRKL